MSQNKTLPNGEDKSMSLQEVFPASLSAMLGSEEARMMTATSGRILSELYPRSDLLGSLVRMLLESPRWSSRARYLKWIAKPLYSERLTTFTDTDTANPLPSNESAETLNNSDMQSSRLLFQLVPLEPPTEEIESSLLLQTPTVVQTDETPEKMKVKPFFKTPCSWDAKDNMKTWDVPTSRGTLGQQARMGKLDALLPTPNACDYNTTWSEEAKMECLERREKEGKTAFPSKFNSLRQLAREELLPTPTYMEGVKWTNTWNPNSQMGQSLSAMAGSNMLPTPYDWKLNRGMLPTPRAMEVVERPEAQARRLNDRTGNQMNSIQSAAAFGMLDSMTPDALKSKSENVGETSRLSPLFTEEMMGFPFLWTALPFLSQSGETKASKPTETP